MRRLSTILWILVLLAGCKKAAAPTPQLVGTWVAMAPMPQAFSFSTNGTYQSQTVGDRVLRYGSYVVKGNTLTLHPAISSIGEDMTFSISFDGPEKVNLKPVPPPEAGKVTPEMLEAMTIRMRKAGPGEILNREAIARSQDPNDALVASARPPSDSDECVSRVKQITLGLLMYSQDYDDTFPQQSWQGPLFPYVKDLSVFDCPALQKSGGRFGYALNGGLMGTRMAVIKQPDIVPAVFDSNLLGAGAIGDISNLANPPRHAEGNTMSYADGHVKVLPP